MGRKKVSDDEKLIQRRIGLSNNEVSRILKLTGREKLKDAVRDMLLMLEDIQGADPELIVKINIFS